jgi:tRNA threonylcarbamoyl adenosine modification protein (Sua5/YciO/YrdC/YwlC family)
MLLKIYPENPNSREISKVVNCLQNGGIIIFPTDTIYGIGCDIHNHKAVERISELIHCDISKSNFSFIFNDLSHISDYSKPLNNSVFKLLKRTLPGPYTYIVEANNNVPKIFNNKKKTIGIRIPDNSIIKAIVSELGSPILSKSVKDLNDDFMEFVTDPELIYEQYCEDVDIIIDGGYGGFIPSTVINCIGDDFEIVREGLGSTVGLF